MLVLMIAFYVRVSYQKKIVVMFVVFQDGRQKKAMKVRHVKEVQILR